MSLNHKKTCGYTLIKLLVVIAVLAAMQLSALANDTYLPVGKPDAFALLTPPPLPGSPEQAADLAEVQAVYHAATSNEIAAADSEEKTFTDVFNFTPAVGDFFKPGKFPKTEAFFKRVQEESEAVVESAKAIYNRPRPYKMDPSLVRARPETNSSYPSGHASETMVLALVLADLFPDKHDAIIAISRDIGWHRVVIGDHYPTDIYAGRVLAQAIVREMKASPDFQKDFAGAKAEIAAAQK
jgi:acid phosphatase (class A)